ncbi:hypothetical protein AURDEDRAFT_119241 [Auricularia subglabra TFB-10046 SS5]|nr:hypothetical protein AURDEDRAFT_119241 [Auricularia subglabra TFB-10046 SS5]
MSTAAVSDVQLSETRTAERTGTTCASDSGEMPSLSLTKVVPISLVEEATTSKSEATDQMPQQEIECQAIPVSSSRKKTGDEMQHCTRVSTLNKIRPKSTRAFHKNRTARKAAWRMLIDEEIFEAEQESDYIESESDGDEVQSLNFEEDGVIRTGRRASPGF